MPRRAALPEAAASGRIGIVGAGISGLVLATLLKDSGFEPTIIEARDEPGGRILSPTVHPGVRVEAGAARIPDRHSGTMYWLTRAGLSPRTFYPDKGRMVRIDGKDCELGVDVARLGSQQIHHLIAGQQQWSSQYRASLRSRVETMLTKPIWYGLGAGMQALPESLADTLSESIRYGVPVHGVRQDDGSVTLVGDTELVESFERVVVTPATAAYRNIEFVPALSAGKLEVMAGCRTQSSLRTFVVCDRGPWLTRHNLNGWGCSADGLEIWCRSALPEQDLAVLTIYAQGDAAHSLVSMSKPERERDMVERLTAVYPEIHQSIRRVDSYCWDDNIWTRGAQTVVRPDGQGLSILQRKEGRLHFAGETTTADGWIEGAIASAYRVFDEIISEYAATRGTEPDDRA